MSGDGPEMAPQSLSDAIEQMLAELSRRPKTKEGDAWQRVLTLQILNTLADAPPLEAAQDLEIATIGQELRAVLLRGVTVMMRTQPALAGALAAAFGLTPGDTTPPTAFELSGLGRIILLATLMYVKSEQTGRDAVAAALIQAAHLVPEPERSAKLALAAALTGPAAPQEEAR